MYRSIVKLFGFGAEASSSPRSRRQNPSRAFRPAFDHLEARDVPAAPASLTALSSQAATAGGQSNPIAVVSMQPAPVNPYENYRPVAPSPLTPAPNVVSGPAKPEIWYTPLGDVPPNVASGPAIVSSNPNGPEPYRIVQPVNPDENFRPVAPSPLTPAPNVNSGPTVSPLNPNGPEPYRLYSEAGANGNTFLTGTQGTNGAAPVAVNANASVPIKVEVSKDGKTVTYTFPGGVTIAIEVKNASTTVTTIKWPGGKPEITITTTRQANGDVIKTEEIKTVSGATTTTTTTQSVWRANGGGSVVKVVSNGVTPSEVTSAEYDSKGNKIEQKQTVRGHTTKWTNDSKDPKAPDWKKTIDGQTTSDTNPPPDETKGGFSDKLPPKPQ